MNVILSFIINFSLTLIIMYTFYSLFSVTKTFIIASDNGYDELEKKALIDSLAVSMLVLMVVHVLQIIASAKYKHLFYDNIYIPIISPGMPYGGFLASHPLHIESIAFDAFLVALIYNINKLRYELITKKQFFRPFIVICSILFLVFILTLG